MGYSVRIEDIGYLTHQSISTWSKRIAIKHAKEIVDKWKPHTIYVENELGDISVEMYYDDDLDLICTLSHWKK